MIIRTAMVRDELDVLAMTFEELDGHVDVHVISEATVDFHGRPKPLHLSGNLGRFARWKDRLIVVTSHGLPDSPDPWVREHAQRDAMMPTLEAIASADDTVLICDGDEIPSGRAISAAVIAREPVGLMMRTAHSAVDWLYPGPCPGSVIAPWPVIQARSLSQVRDGRPGYPVVRDGGWHFSWLGGPQRQAEKLAVSCHLELPELEKQILASGSGYRDGRHYGVQMLRADVDDDWPAMIRERRCPPEWFARDEEMA